MPVGSGDSCVGPICNWRLSGGPWRGRTYFDLAVPGVDWSARLLEIGPLRVTYLFDAKFAGGGWYKARVSVDAGQAYADISEEFKGGAGDQIVWDLSGDDLPDRALLLTSEAGTRPMPLRYLQDQRVARLCAWNQYTQLLDLSDGFALGFAGLDETVGFVTLEAGTWRGNRLNHLEAWQRRWLGEDAASRRDVPGAAKADTQISPERIVARGNSCAAPHFNLEGWIGQGSRRFALVVARETEITAPAEHPGGEPQEFLNHFEKRPDRERYRESQSLLRQINTQRGVMSLAKLASTPLPSRACGPFPIETGTFQYPTETLNLHLYNWADLDEAARIRTVTDYMEARVYGFWEASGSSYSNCVASRSIAPYSFYFEWLVREGLLSDEQEQHLRSLFLFMAELFDSDNYYPGLSSMLPVESADALDPTLGGLANQNFYTDIYNVPGTTAEVFAGHPNAARWREKFGAMWKLQLEYHMYPESGLWEESHTYYIHVLHTVLPTFLRRRDADNGDEFALWETRKLVASALKQISPRDDWFDGLRHLVAIGDHGVDNSRLTCIAREFAEALAPHDAELASHLLWLAHETTSTVGTPLAASRISPKPTPWTSEYVQGLGYMMRSVAHDGHQSLLALRSGAAWAHHHNDAGSIQLFARGRSLVVDSAFGDQQDDENKKYLAYGHSRWTLRDYQALNFLWRYNTGWITEASPPWNGAASTQVLPYALSYNPLSSMQSWKHSGQLLPQPIDQYRAVVQLTPDAYIVADANDASEHLAAVVRWHLAGDGLRIVSNGGLIKFGDEEFRVMPLLTGLRLGGTTTDRAKREPERYVTTEMAYPLGGGAPSLFLLVAGDAPEVRIVASGAIVGIGSQEWRVSLLRERGGRPEQSAGTEIWMGFGLGLQEFGWILRVD